MHLFCFLSLERDLERLSLFLSTLSPSSNTNGGERERDRVTGGGIAKVEHKETFYIRIINVFPS